ncbi:hypothetical protein Ga0100231_012665 [Opitutaceae bacterium TAV4]|nr:hypothetical protein Ga0100231_012665 [Opitutaceae bacterium TAV4]RRJ99293.1 hypothetical protein Ga0100230_013950 [Opitutaceae bacterium TAV3]
MKTAKFSISLTTRAAGKIRCFALRLDGERMQELPVMVKNGTLTLDIDTAALTHGPTSFFELMADRPPHRFR